ncbi:hypothetical protein LS482_03700 [Sinomicrobium kalidii]|uniref:immunoglobulin domain-containing protein n=1 Tax=Sinomicrobium kalidii TaxID=2900738 RepID=UPI001E5A227B|nr:hypothetical protein [Sinomicrobium kalidii]UGU16982.1 hypothetical protein LS482_03700 [Sinomicrobium kalidii]
MYLRLEHRAVVILYILLFPVLCGFNPVWGQQAQERVYAVSQTNGALLGAVSNPGNVVGGNIETNAALSVPVGALGLSSAYIQPRFSTLLSAGTTTYLKLGINSSLLGVGISISVQAYNNGSAVGTQVTLGSLLSLLNGEYLDEMVFTPQDSNGNFVAYDAVRITLNGGILSAGANMDVYYAYYLRDATTSIVCNTPEEVLYGSIGTLLSGVNQVENPLNSIDGDYNTYTHLRSNVGVADKTYIKSLYNTLSREGDSVRVVFQNPDGGLLDASLLASSFTIRTYNDDTDNGALALDENLLSLSLLPGSSDVQVLTYPVEVVFNRIEVAIGEGLLNALGSMYVYEMERVLKAPDVISPEMVDGIVYACFGDEVTLQIDQPVTDSTYNWYTEASGGTPVFSGTSYTPDTTVAGTHYFYVSETRTGCTDESGRAVAQVVVHPSYSHPDISIGNTTN